MKSRNLIILTLAFFLIPAVASADQLKVITRENAIRKDCKFFSPVVKKIKNGDVLDVASEEGDWFRVVSGDVKGCVHKSAVELKKFRLVGLFGKKAEASSDEVALAGKGFNPQVESAYKRKHPDLNFALVDRIEELDIPQDKLVKFIKEGGLNLP